MEREVIEGDIVLPTHLGFKKIQMYEKYPKGQARGRHWKHLKQIIQAENYSNYPPDEPNYVNIETPPSLHPCKRICDITGFEAPYYDPRTNLRYANAEVFKLIRSLPNEYVQSFQVLLGVAFGHPKLLARSEVLRNRDNGANIRDTQEEMMGYIS